KLKFQKKFLELKNGSVKLSLTITLPLSLKSLYSNFLQGKQCLSVQVGSFRLKDQLVLQSISKTLKLLQNSVKIGISTIFGSIRVSCLMKQYVLTLWPTIRKKEASLC